MIYELSPRFDSRKSFYHKAIVEDVIDSEKNIKKTLYSYETPVATYVDSGSDNMSLSFGSYADYSATTRRHVWDFVRQLEIPCFMSMYRDFKFKSLPDFLRKVDRLVYNGARGTITLWNGNEVFHVYSTVAEE